TLRKALTAVAFFFIVEQANGAAFIDTGEDIGVAVVLHQADQRTFENKKIRLTVRSCAHLGTALVETVVGQVHRVLDGAFAARIAPDVDDWQVPAHVPSGLAALRTTARSAGNFSAIRDRSSANSRWWLAASRIFTSPIDASVASAFCKRTAT